MKYSKIMKKLTILLISVFVLNCISYGQFKRPEDGNRINKNTNNLILGIFNPKNFSMYAQFSGIYAKFGIRECFGYILR